MTFLSFFALNFLASCEKGATTNSQILGKELKPVEKVVFETSEGKMVFELNTEKAPITVKNFIDYVESGHYDGTIFHRVIDGFVIQGGGLDEKMNTKPTKAPIKNESHNGLSNVAMSLSMARTIAMDSATSQFFINLVDNTATNGVNLDGGKYAVFGKVVEGQEVVKKIAKVETGSVGPYDDVPKKPITVVKASRLP